MPVQQLHEFAVQVLVVVAENALSFFESLVSSLLVVVQPLDVSQEGIECLVPFVFRDRYHEFCTRAHQEEMEKLSCSSLVNVKL